uniref:Phosphorylated CTD interacting factor 1 WW domain protein n=1 Tax=Pithovirus LCDPAC01 TaxID=2506600 RepID=A0A481YNR1_9VIRU|nr:MAG: phosphorylated CTD interacting factor 1 WW domain protein [Pithovirus LCDPAC01]
MLKNVFYWISSYKDSIVDILSKRSKGDRIRYENAFIKWYFNTENKQYIPIKSVVDNEDLKYWEEQGYLKPDSKLEKELKEAYSRFVEDAASAVDEYEEPKDFINDQQRKRLNTLYKGDPLSYEKNKNIMLSLYYVLGGRNNHLSAPKPNLKLYSFELFGTPLNTQYDYCSPFEIDKVFGSYGSFFDFKIVKGGMYYANPPYDDKLMTRAMKKIIRTLMTVKAPLTIAVTLPVWDPKTQREYKFPVFSSKFESYDILTGTGRAFVRDHKVFTKKEFNFYDYFDRSFIPIANTHLFILSNRKDPYITIERYMQLINSGTNKKNKN